MAIAKSPRNPGFLRRADQHDQLPDLGRATRCAARSSTRCSTTTRTPARSTRARSRRSSQAARRSGRHASTGCSRPTPTPTTCPARPTSRPRPARRIGIGEHIKDVQRIFRPVFNATDLHTDGRDFDRLFADGETIRARQPRRSRCSTRPATRRPTSATRSATRSSSATRCSCRTTAPRAPIFPAATRTSSIARSAGSSACRRRRASSCATTTRRRAATPTPGRRRCARERETSVHVKDGVSEDEFVAMRTDARPDAGRAAAAPAVDPGQHPRRPLPARREQRRPLPDDPGQAEESQRPRRSSPPAAAPARLDADQSVHAASA